ncbi:hypothetical protein ABH931_000215 [Streptacidiphilus sp. MAP12-33]|uniref:hypothetical protein n=1 Tax=Streptacidiphilus sp. MAP12-33 TaxID=3156266 RepID=UPI00351651C8
MHTGTTAGDETVETTPGPPERRVPERPVFVDASGRRQRRVRLIGRVLVVPAVGYIGLLVSTLLGGPTINSPYLPLPAPPQAPGSHTHGASGGGTHGTGANGTGTGTGTKATGGTGTTAATGATTGATAGPSATPSALPSVTASPSTVITHGHSTHTANPPGASHHPTKKARATAR